MNRTPRSIRRAGVAAGVAAIAFVALATPAWAHVEAEGETAATGLTTVTFSFSHGCSGSPTTSLKIQLPEGTTEVAGENPAGWSSTVSGSELAWSGGSVPDHDEGSFTATMRIVGTKGDTVFLPTVQGCEVGSEAWIEKTDDAEADSAAPRIVLTETVAPASTDTSAAAGTSSTSTTAASSSTTSPTSEAASASTDESDSNSNAGLIVIIAVVAVIVIGAVVLYLRNRRPSTP